MLVHTDFGHDPDDVIALAYLIERGVYPSVVGITPGHDDQIRAVCGFLKEYDHYPLLYTTSPPKKEYVAGKHSMFFGPSHEFHIWDSPLNRHYTNAIVIGPAKGLSELSCDNLFFQGGYSPNSVKPLEKFKGRNSLPSFNPNGARGDFKAICLSQTVKVKRFIGKNVCHGFTKEDLIKHWSPQNKKVKQFFDLLPLDKVMHDVLVSMIFVNPEIAIWEQARPTWNKCEYSTEPTTEEIYSLIGTSL